MFSRIREHITYSTSGIVFGLTTIISITAYLYYYSQNLLFLALMDSIPRLNFARKVIDNITPGIGQLGAVWLPFPHALWIPFIKNDFMWKSGLPGSLMSMLFFTFASIYLFKLVWLLTKGRLLAFVSWLLFVTNQNMLFLQTSPMSEPLYVFCIVMVLYYLTRWYLNRSLGNLLRTALFLIIITLTRYEGYIILAGVWSIVVITNLLSIKDSASRKKAEGMSILFMTLSVVGVLLWSLYLGVIFKQPFFWLSAYVGGQDTVLSSAGLARNADTIVSNSKTTLPPIQTYIYDYFITVVLSTGMVTSLLAVMGAILFSIKSLIKKEIHTEYIVTLLLGLFLTLFMIVGLWKSFIPGLTVPALSLQSFLTKTTNALFSVNMRYGMAVLPFICVFYAYLFNWGRIGSFVGGLVIILQLAVNTFTPIYLIYNMPQQHHRTVDRNALLFKDLYKGGYVLISDHAFQYFIFDTGLPYRDLIQEGNQKYWIQSLKRPQKYATWVIYDENNKDDAVRNFLQTKKKITDNYELVYSDGGLRFYKIKGYPEQTIKIGQQP